MVEVTALDLLHLRHAVEAVLEKHGAEITAGGTGMGAADVAFNWQGKEWELDIYNPTHYPEATDVWPTTPAVEKLRQDVEQCLVSKGAEILAKRNLDMLDYKFTWRGMEWIIAAYPV